VIHTKPKGSLLVYNERNVMMW